MISAIIYRMTRLALAVSAAVLGWVCISAFREEVVDPTTVRAPAIEGLDLLMRPEPIFQRELQPPPPGRQWQVPRWAVSGILEVETKSQLRPDDTVKYVDKRRGRNGERGPTQIRRIAFEQVKEPGEQFWRVESDPTFAIAVTERYLLWLYRQTRSWSGAVKAYNAGLGGRRGEQAQDYYERVRAAGRG
jgi:hypothetical protein